MNQNLLKKILSQPSAPFREMHVTSAIEAELKRTKTPYFVDPIGNLILGAKNKKEYLAKLNRKTKEPLRIFIAHMDHPGFHGVEWKNSKTLKVKWHGGSPVKHLNGTPMWVANKNGWLESKTILKKAKLHATGRAILEAELQFNDSKVHDKNKTASEIFGGFRFQAPYWIKNKIIYTKAADDLVGSFAILSVATALKAAHRKDFIGILTRAEEVGFIGLIGHLELGWVTQAKRKVVCVSLETSRTLPGAIVGKGPVVRLGDRTTVFDPNALQVLLHVAQTEIPKDFQKRIMDGGSCEGTAATAYGLSAVGISVPLGNYHNEGYEGGPGCRGVRGPAPEFVHLNDISGLLKLCHGLMKPGLPWNTPWLTKRKLFSKAIKDYQKLL